MGAQASTEHPLRERRRGMMSDDFGLPMVVFPRRRADAAGQHTALQACADRYLSRLGSILFRGFGVEDADAFARFTSAFARPLLRPSASSALSLGLMHGIGADAFQHVLSLSECLPRTVFLACMRTPHGGPGLLADTREVYRRLPDPIRARFEARGVRYVWRLDDPALMAAFHTTDRLLVARRCRAAGLGVDAPPDDVVTVTRSASATALHPWTRQKVWFNEAHRFAALAADGASGVCHADGTAIPPAMLDEIGHAYAEASLLVSWEPGDVLMLDNLLTARSCPSDGEQLVSLADPHALAPCTQ
jgi:hypothetical protein